MPLRVGKLFNCYRALLCSACVFVTACTGKQVYQGIQAGHVNHCYLYPYEQAQQCLSEVTLPYEEYERKRQQVLQQQNQQQKKPEKKNPQ